jgi:hypothetical protein
LLISSTAPEAFDPSRHTLDFCKFGVIARSPCASGSFSHWVLVSYEKSKATYAATSHCRCESPMR